jgi:hypothetical protein
MAADIQRASKLARRRGAVVVEASLTLLVFVVLMTGTFDCGQVLLLHKNLGDRMRRALRYGSVHATDLNKVQNILLYGQPSERPGQESFGLSRENVQVVREAEGTAHDRILIKVTGYSVTFLTPVIARTTFGRPMVGSIPVESF